MLAVPELLVPDVATKVETLEALTVAPLETIITSLVVKSEMVSTPASILNVSAPAPPINISLLAPPVILSLPLPPVTWSTPAFPEIVKFSVFLPAVERSFFAQKTSYKDTIWVVRGRSSTAPENKSLPTKNIHRNINIYIYIYICLYSYLGYLFGAYHRCF